MENVAAQVPGDKYVLANLMSVKRFATQLEQQWEEQCRVKQTEVCRYRILGGSNYSLSSFSKSLLEFQGLFTQIFDAKKNGVKKRARITPDMARQTSFDFGFSYPGSLGVALTIQGQSDLFEGGFDQAIDAFMDALKIDDEYQVRDTASSLGDAVIKRIYDWSSVNLEAEYEVDISWTTSKGLTKGGLIGTSDLSKIVEAIRQTSEAVIRSVSVSGTLLGLDSKTGHFRFVPFGDGPDYSGKAASDFPILKNWKLNSNYEAEISIEEITYYATQETKKSYKLKSLSYLNSN
jgi:hypothetical protein